MKILKSAKDFSYCLADMVAHWRIGDKIMGALWVILGYEAWEWFSVQEDLSAPQSAFLSAIIAASVGFCKLYLDTCPKKGKKE